MAAGPSYANAATDSVWPWVEPIGGFVGPDPPARGWPKITIVTPNYNYGHLIERTIRSVVLQRYPGLEYIVVDDGSTDESVAVIQRYEGQLARWEHRPNRGQYEAVNRGFELGSGEVCAWLDSDDIHLPWTLWCVGRIFAEFPEVDWLVGHPAVFFDGVLHHVRPLRPFPRELIRAGLFHGYSSRGLGWISQENLFWRRRLWDRAGPLRTELRLAADYEMNVRFAENAELYAVSTVLGGFSLRPGQNRSTVHRGQYVSDIERVLGELRAKGRTLPAISLYRKVRRVPLVRGFVARATGVRKYTGPVLRWDFEAAAYRVHREVLNI